MTWLAETCMLAHGWRRALLLVAAGAIAALSMPPLFFLPALFLAFPVWVWSLDGAERSFGWGRFFSAAFRIGFFFGFGYFTVALHWLGAAFFVDGGWYLWVMPFAVLAIAAVLALFWGTASALAHLFWSPGPARIFVLAGMLSLFEFARGHLFTGFPFDLLGYALTANAQMMQAASLVGIYGLTALAALLAMVPALVWPATERSLATRLIPIFLALVVIAAQIGFGQWRLTAIELVPRDDMRLRLVQPSIPQAQKWDPVFSDTIIDQLIALSELRTGPGNPGLIGVTHLVWPEAALPHFLADHPEILARIARMLPAGTVLLTGAPHLETEPGLIRPGQPIPAYNSILAINAVGEIVSTYRKEHLVPVGEYLPFKRVFDRFGLSQFVPGANGWEKGPPRRAMRLAATPPFMPLICYEAVFSGQLGTGIAESAFLLNLTNDAWFDGSIGPAQHFHHARLRAVEEGKSLIRVANSGVTALVDPLGQITARLAEGQRAVLDVTPDQPLAGTLFARWRHLPFFGGVLAMLMIGFIGFRKSRSERSKVFSR